MPSKIPEEDLLDDLQRVAVRLGHSPSIAEYRVHGNHSINTIQKHFGSWNEAKMELGLDVDVRGEGSDGMNLECYNCGNGFRSNRKEPYCPNCGAHLTKWRARVRYYNDVDVVQKLSQGPVAGKGDFSIAALPDDVRQVVQRLGPFHSQWSDIKSGNQIAVYYLPGDIRRAVNLYIEENYRFVEESLGSRASGLRQKLPQDIFEMFVEQYEWNFNDEM